jgi:hypothetical protein
VSGEAVPDHGQGDHGCGGGADSLQDPQRAEREHAGCNGAQQAGQDVYADAGEERTAPAQDVGQRPDDELADAESDQGAGQGPPDSPWQSDGCGAVATAVVFSQIVPTDGSN